MGSANTGVTENKEECEENKDGLVKYCETDTTYFGAKIVVEEELEYIRKRRRSLSKTTEQKAEEKPAEEDQLSKNLNGLALSGGGIRSASFGLGVMQALAHNGWLKKFDYLSTVSGGGYTGSSLSWLLSQNFDTQDKKTTRFGVEKENFPYGVYPMSGAHPKERLENSGKNLEPISERYKGKLLRYLRQQAKYLTPGDGINALSLVAPSR